MWDISPTPSFFLCFVVAMNDPSLCFRRQCLLVTHPTHPSKRFVGNSAQYCNLAEQIEQVQKKHDCLAGFYLSIFLDSANYCIIYIILWATVNIWYIAPSHQFLKSVLLFFRFWYISKCYRFLQSLLSFSKPQLNLKKIKMSRILLSIKLNFG